MATPKNSAIKSTVDIIPKEKLIANEEAKARDSKQAKTSESQTSINSSTSSS
jgi:hypothetical protein